MNENLLTFRFTEDVVPFLDLFLTEKQLDYIILNYPNISILYTSLKVKHYYVLHGRQQKIAFPLKSIFNKLTSSNLDEICDVLELSVLVQDIDSATASYLECVHEFCEKGRYTHIILKLLNVITNIHCYMKLKLPDGFNESVIQNLLLEVFNNNSNLLRNLFCKVLIKYVECISDVKNILSFILSLQDLYTISCCFDVFVHHKHLISNNFWVMIIENFNSGNYNRKLSLNILKQYIDYVSKYDKFNEESDIIKGNTQSNEQFIESWNNYFLLIELSQEKSLHLITPALKLIPTVSALHSSWLLCLYKFFLSHPQNLVVFSVSKNILTTDIIYNIEFFQNIINSLLSAWNKYEYTENYFELFKQFKNFSHNLDDSLYCILLKESLKIKWSPISAWYFYSSIIEGANKDINFSLIIHVLNSIKGIPHSFIRNNCYIITLNFLIKQKYFSCLTLDGFIKLAVEVKKCDEHLLLLFYHCTHNNIKLYNQDVSMEIFSVLQDSSIDAIEILFQIINFNSQHAQLIENILLSELVADEIGVYLALYLCKHQYIQFNVVDYLERKLQNQNCDNDINILCNIAEHVRLTSEHSSFTEKCKFIIINPAKYKQNDIALAFKIYSSNIDKDVIHIVKIWNTKVLNGDKIQSRVCKYYLDTYFSYLKDSHSITSDLQANYQVIARIFDTQNEDVCSQIYENFEILLMKHDNHSQPLEFVEKLFDELNNFGSIMIRAWSLFIKTILQNINIFTEENVMDIIVPKITQFSMINDSLANVFINELLNVSENCGRLFINLIIDLIFYGGIIRKDKRCEYAACKDIDSIVNPTITNNPNYIHTNIRTTAINVVLRILNEDRHGIDGDFICRLCLQRYHQYFQKRYFPDSDIHLSKLRCVQLLFVLLPYVSNRCKAEIIDFIIESICLESHQPCVRQLMQWLLVVLLINDSDRTMKIFEIIDKPEGTHISAITAFIQVLYHLAVKSDEKFIENSIRVLLTSTTGAHFKLRLYSQIVITKLIEMCIQKQFAWIPRKFDAIYESIKTVLVTTGSSVENTLQTDKAFLEQFNVDKHYNLHLIYKGIPQLNNVIETEWEYIDLQLISHNKHVATEGTVIDIKNVARRIRTAPDNQLDIPVNNIQIKISPPQDLKVMPEDHAQQNRTTELILVATLIENGANLGGFARTCEIYGIKELVISDRKIVTEKEFRSLSMTAENWVNIIEVKRNDLGSYFDKVKEDGYVIVGVEQTQESFKLQDYTFPKKCALVLGNEKEGIPPYIYPFLDACVEIPQFGLLRSLNVHVAGAIVVWEYVKQNIL